VTLLFEKVEDAKAIVGPLIFVGSYGSGKTEVAVNYARGLAQSGVQNVHLVDLDIVNPYFRSRETIHDLSNEGVRVVAPEGENFYAELPIIVPEVRTLCQGSKGRVILDVGGDDAGATVLASLKDVLTPGRCEFWIVLNARRPFTDTVDSSIRMIRQIEQAASLSATGIISNTHLLSETTLDIIEEGIGLARAVADRLSLPIPFVGVQESLVSRAEEVLRGIPVLPLRLTMLRPWERKSGKGGGIAEN
jgi:hypothetical protein